MKTRTISAAILIAILTPLVIIGKIPFAVILSCLPLIAGFINDISFLREISPKYFIISPHRIFNFW